VGDGRDHTADRRQRHSLGVPSVSRQTIVMVGLLGLVERQEAFEKCWAHSPLRAAERRLF